MLLALVALAVMVTLSLGAGRATAASEGAIKPAPAGGEVVVYTALDQIYSEPILKGFEAESGLRVRVVYDSEAAKTTGLVSRLLAERARPRCDVFWNNEIIQTLQLKSQGALAPYVSPGAAAIPAPFKDAESYWTGLAARARVLVYNTSLVKPADAPAEIEQLTDPRWRGKVGLAYPLFGTMATHAAVLRGEWGAARAEAFFGKLKANGVATLDGNMGVCRAVADGELALGLTDTDDASLLRGQGRPIDFVLLGHAGQGALLVPNTVSLVKGAPHPESAKKLIDYLLRPATEEVLAKGESAQIPLHPGVAAPPAVAKLAAGPFLKVDYVRAAAQLPASAEFLKKTFARQ